MNEHRCPFWLVCLNNIEGPGLDGVYSIDQGHLFFQKATYVYVTRLRWSAHHPVGLFG